MQICKSCNKPKTTSEFYAQPSSAAGIMNICKECHKAKMRVRARTNPAVQAYDRQRAKSPKRKAAIAANAKRWRDENPDAYKAHNAVNNAVRDGKLEKLPCDFCGDQKVEAHHKDYARPLDVVWLCAKCHKRLHANFPQLEGANKRIGASQ